MDLTIQEGNFISRVVQFRLSKSTSIPATLLAEANELPYLREYVRNIARYMLGESVDLPEEDKTVADKLMKNHQIRMDSLKQRRESELKDLRSQALRLGYKLVKIKRKDDK